MSTISIQNIQRDPGAFLRRVEAGEAFVVVRDERPLAEIRPVVHNDFDLRPFGLCAGQFRVPSNFDEPLPANILQDFEGT